ncbi:hypothetical protein T484DRAFT_3128352 [Baffinella frigidus]|nr:hypothetical protein T484DRAFT_3128352 [Cryptophyta sp. CCMP2293]
MDAEHDLGWQAPSMAADPEEAGILIEEDRAMDGLVGQLLGMDVDPPPPLVSADGEWQYVHLKVKGQVCLISRDKTEWRRARNSTLTSLPSRLRMGRTEKSCTSS